MPDLNGKKIAFLVAPEGIEQIELTQPWKAVRQAGGEPVLISTQAGAVQAMNHLDKADTFPVDVVVSDASVSEYAALVLPGGVANPDALRTSRAAVTFVQQFAASVRPIAAICHAPWTLVEVGMLPGRRLTSWPSLQTDLRNAGAEWVDEEVVVDLAGPGPLITSRNPDDLEAFTEALLEAISTTPY
ncbi:MAG: type 1 glutamine amidotransferase domain-containing protein, partial [Janthinobacterium lividum]